MRARTRETEWNEHELFHESLRLDTSVFFFHSLSFPWSAPLLLSEIANSLASLAIHLSFSFLNGKNLAELKWR